uniref:hypothetical protein n=1 Tax=Thaumasiovibrio occultus TaxID=1891184 RepID=UPI000B358479|nr:hypothetical protein [Thaumasiovibrio occultus]
MAYPDHQDIYAAMTTLLTAYVPEPKCSDMVIRLETMAHDQQFPPGKWVLHQLDTWRREQGVSLTPEHADLYRQICEYCI